MFVCQMAQKKKNTDCKYWRILKKINLRKKYIFKPTEDLILMENFSTNTKANSSDFSIKILYGSVTGKSKVLSKKI